MSDVNTTYIIPTVPEDDLKDMFGEKRARALIDYFASLTRTMNDRDEELVRAINSKKDE